MKLLQERMAHIYKLRAETMEGDRGQITLVKASGASKSQVNQWLSGAQQSIRIEHALRIEAELGFSHVWLMTGIGDPIAKPGQVVILESPPAEHPRLTLAEPKELDLLDFFRRATDRAQLNILDIARMAERRPTTKLRGDKG